MDSYWAWNLNKVEPVWYNKDLPTTTHFENNNFKSKTIGDLKLKDGVKTNMNKYIEKIKVWSLYNRREIVLFAAGFILGAIIF